MPRYFAFLRAINIGGHTVKNTELVKLFAKAGFADAEPFIASGNVVFDARAGAPSITAKLEAQFRKSLGYEVRTFLRTRDELEAIAAHEPFDPARRKSAVVLNVGFLEAPATPEQKQIIAGFENIESDFHVKGRETYWLCQVRQSESKFLRIPFEKRIGAAATWRNRNTVERLLAKYPG